MAKQRWSMTSLAILLAAGCGSTTPAPETAPAPEPVAEEPAPVVESVSYDGLERAQFNQLAQRLNLPVYWLSDANENGVVDPAEVHALLFYPSSETYVADGAFTDAFKTAYKAMEAALANPPTDARVQLVVQDLEQGAPTLVYNDLREESEGVRKFVSHMAKVATLVDDIYAQQVGLAGVRDSIAQDAPSQSMARRNWGIHCKGPSTQNNEACSATTDASAKQTVGVYPAEMQGEDNAFCAELEKHADSKTLLDPFTVVKKDGENLTAVPYHEAFAQQMKSIAAELKLAAEAMANENEAPLIAYLNAAAQGFLTNNWEPANEAWAAMNVKNSRFYVRVGPDEVYWEPCSRKAGFHLTFAKINPDSLAWQDKLTPLQADMEKVLQKLSRGAYKARNVSFHMPDFIDIIWNSGDDRNPFGATIGQSLPNWGPVAEEGRGRTVAMSNLYTDPDSIALQRKKAESLLTAESMANYSDDQTPGLLSTILHEATHNLGPASEYRYRGKTDDEAFGGPMASMLEELKSQNGALYYLQMMKERGAIDETLMKQSYVNSIVWALGHISGGMYTPGGQRKAYSQLAAVQVGFLMDAGVLEWKADATAANGTDQGAFEIHLDKFAAEAEKLMKKVLIIKAKNDRKGAEALAKRYVDGDTVPMAVIAERFRRFPKGTMVYSLDL